MKVDWKRISCSFSLFVFLNPLIFNETDEYALECKENGTLFSTPEEFKKGLGGVPVIRSDKEKFEFGCFFGAKRKSKHTSEISKQRKKGSMKDGCEWKVYLRFQKSLNKWKVTSVTSDHNHELEKEIPKIDLPEGMESSIKELKGAGVKPAQIRNFAATKEVRLTTEQVCNILKRVYFLKLSIRYLNVLFQASLFFI